PEVVDAVRRLAGPGPGRCLDLGCGTGFHLATLRDLGWTVTGVDLSDDQLRIARDRADDFAEIVEEDAAEIPFEDAAFSLVFSAFTHTDFEDFARLLREAVRVLEPRGRLVYLGPHPCFVGPHSRFIEGKGVPKLHPGYEQTRRYTEGAG